MGQREIYDAITQLGGRATFQQIREKMRDKEPGIRGYTIWHAIAALRKNDYISFDWKTEEFVVIAPFPPPNRGFVTEVIVG